MFSLNVIFYFPSTFLLLSFYFPSTYPLLSFYQICTKVGFCPN